jgi:hypothetical protein
LWEYVASLELILKLSRKLDISRLALKIVVGAREQGTGNREQVTGNREQGIGNRE